MKRYWLPLLILGTQLSIFTPNAFAFEAETIDKPVTNIETPEAGLNKWEDTWQSELDTDTSLEKGFHRRRRRRSNLRRRNHGRLRHHRTDHPQVIIIRRGNDHDVYRYGEFRRDDIFFRQDPFRSDRFHRDSFRNDQFQHRRHHHNRIHRDEFRLIIRGD
ncbi:MAG: hypothetical protein F6K11_23895 [Leptolyngbya sp. SIO3F4]|nr:hypothetical protein [Leptolyngbya sp. SIO3F4]